MAKSKGKSKSKKSQKQLVSIGQYLLAKNGKTKYIKLQVSPNAPSSAKKLLKSLVKLLGTDVLFVNLFDNDFKADKKIPDFVKGSIRIEDPTSSSKSDDDDDDDSDDEEETDDDESGDEEESDDDDDEEDDDDDSDDDDTNF